MQGKPQERPKRRVKPERRRAVRRARIILVVVLLMIVTLITMAVMLLRGLFESRSETTLLSVESGGALVFEEVMEIPAEYDADGVYDYVSQQIDAFTPSQGESVTLERTAVDGQKAYVRIRYSSPEVYEAFTGYETFYGTISAAKSRGYEFGDTFLSAEGEFDENGAVTAEEATADQDLYVFIIEECVEVAVNGDILYVSKEGTKVSDGKVSIDSVDGNKDAPPLCYIIFKQ